MDRVLERCECTYSETGCSDCELNQNLNLLDNYRNLGTVEELTALLQKQRDGLLIELPVPFGKEVYIHSGDPRDESFTDVSETAFTWWLLSSWGQTVFSTREAAKKALEEQRENKG